MTYCNNFAKKQTNKYKLFTLFTVNRDYHTVQKYCIAIRIMKVRDFLPKKITTRSI